MKSNRIIAFFREHRLSYGISIALMLTASYAQALGPKILGKAVDIMKSEAFDKKLVLHYIGLLVLAASCAFIFAYIWRRVFIGNSRKLECSLREDLFRHMQTLSPSFYGGRKTGDLIAYAVNDIAAVRKAFGPAVAIALSGLVTCAYSIFNMAVGISLRMTLICLLPIPPLVVFIVRTGRSVQQNFREVQKSFAGISDRVQENISGIRVIKSYVQEGLEIEAFGSINDNMRSSSLSLVRLSSRIAPSIEIGFGLSFAASLILGWKMIADGSMTLGQFVAFNSYLTLMVRPITIIGRVVNNIQMGNASVKRLDEIFSAGPDVEYPPDGRGGDIAGDIELKSVSFSYKGAQSPALDRVNLKIGAGRTVGITGKTGSGKSTLADIILRCFDPDSGEVLLDGVNIKEYSEKAVKKSFGLVPQEAFLFSAPVRDNIAFFRDDYSDGDIAEAARCADIFDTVMSFPKGFETVVGERGADLSGGQQQRLAIARAVIRDAPVLILDDALSAVDAGTEAVILENLKDARRGKTNVVISNKLSALKDADLIAVMDGGRIIEKGSEAELLALRGMYYEIYSEQNAQ